MVPVLIAINLLLKSYINNGLIILVDIVVALVLLGLTELVIKKFKDKKVQKEPKDVVVIKAGALDKKTTKFVNKNNKKK